MENEDREKLGFGLRSLPIDDRDFKLGQIFGEIDLKTIPKEFTISEPLKIKNQKRTDFCAAFALAAVSEDQEGVELDPLYIFAKTKQVEGLVESWGADLRTVCKAAVRFGAIEKTESPHNLETCNRNFIANWRNWPIELDIQAIKHRKKSYFAVSGYGDAFDAIRAALWQHKNEKRSVLTGTIWEKEWTSAKGGVIPKERGRLIGGHALKIFGQTEIDNELYLVAQLSNGTKIGNKGIFYFPREVVNKSFKYGSYLFVDLDPETIKKICWSSWTYYWEKIKKFFKTLLK